MCEDRALRLKKASNARWARLLQARYRTRILQHLQATAPPRESLTTSICVLTDGIQQLTPPSTPPNLPLGDGERVPLHDTDLSSKFPIETYCKAAPCRRARKDALLDIALRTAILMKRNQQLQQKLAALQAETKGFIRTVIKNNVPNALTDVKVEIKEELIDRDDNVE